ncbi:MAG: hypothetical protein ACKOUT_15520, partial [Novosphingobium sp.]
MTSKIKRGVSLYSFQNETFQGKMNLEDCIRTCAELGARGIEVIGEQSFWGWPEVGVAQEDIANWHALIKKYDCVPVSHDYMLDYKRYKDRPMPFDEQVASVKKDIDFGAMLGTPFIRSLVSIDPAVLVAAAPYAEEKGIKMLTEVQRRVNLGEHLDALFLGIRRCGDENFGRDGDEAADEGRAQHDAE